MNKFEEKAIMKQDEAYKTGFAKKQMNISCSICCSQNKRATGTCAQCPIKEAHIKALLEIEQGKRVSPVIVDNRGGAKKSYTRTKSGKIIVTIVVN